MRFPRLVTVAVALCFFVPAVASAHLERPSYWPDPAADTAVTPPAGGAVPKPRSLASAVTGKGPGEVRVVCQGKRSLNRALGSIRRARRTGFRLRPSQPKIRYSAKRARRMTKINRQLFKQCAFDTIQPAVDASGNNDRIVLMPGVYTEPASRAMPSNDPRCNPSLVQKDASGDPTPSYEYQVTCPHDQNLVYVQGRAVVGKPLETPRSNRQGIPEQELGPCVRCNLQIEGSGAKPTDAIIDAGTDYAGKGPEAKPGGHAKDVVLRVDRGDGFVGRNFLVRGAKEHGFYNEETDGVLLDRLKFFWNADYGHLAFTSDHQLIRNCDGMGAGDAVLYPGAAPETGAQATDFYPDAPRMNTTVTKCDMRNSTLGYSGSMGNAVRITNNHIYGNTTGIASDTLSSAGHPGFPADSAQIDNNYIYSNNFNTYR
ncbi:MAG: right-handed parallel beta-helix repeat-containing protein, partial [Solirubrobacteraceae bacterium]